jgi:eukaryotic-like serine/threonine-protein kinase
LTSLQPDPPSNDSPDSEREFGKESTRNLPGSSLSSKETASPKDNASSKDVTSSKDITSPAKTEPGIDVDEKTIIRRTEAQNSRSDRKPLPPSPSDRTPAAVAKVLLGKRLNQFRLDEMIGGGGMGAVFRAHDTQLDRTVAVKVIPFVGEDPELQRRFRNEAQSAARLDHPRIAKVFETGNDDRWHYIVFEYIEGINVRDLVLRDGVMTIDEAVYFTMQLADAIGHAGNRGITHRDIKPSNIVIAEDRIKLVDMGLARSDRFEMNQDMTASGVTLGTFDYISPEQAKDPRDADFRSDLYSLGCTFYFMLTGSPPYPGGTMLQKLLAHGSDPLPDIRKRRPEVSDYLSSVLKRMLAKQPADRYQDSESLVADLKRVAVIDGLRRSRNVGPNVFAPTNSLAPLIGRHLPWIAAATVLLVIGAFLQIQGVVQEQNLVIPPSASAPALRLQSPNISTTNSSFPISNPASESVEPDRPSNPSEDRIKPLIFSSGQVPTPLKGTTTPLASDVAGKSTSVLAVDLHTAFTAGKVRSLLVLGNRMPKVVDVDSEGRFPMTTLQEALDAAAEHRISVIEIGVTELVSLPVRIQTREVTLRSAVGRSVIRWDSNANASTELDSPTSESDSPMPRLNNTPLVVVAEVDASRIEFENLNFVWNISQRVASGSTFFNIVENQSLRLKDCAFTVVNQTNQPVSVFQVASQAPEDTPTVASAIRDSLPTTQMKLNNVIVRGEVSMIQLNDQSSFDLDWSNGLLAISGSMIRSNGSRLPPEQNGLISMSLDQVVVDAQAGLVVTQTDGGNTPVTINRSSTKSVFTLRPKVPLFEFAGLEQLGRNGQWLRLQGTSNAYDAGPGSDDSLLRLVTKDELIQSIPIDELVGGRSPWIQEALPRLSVSWDRVRRMTETPSQRTVAQYRVVQTAAPVGFDESLLPNLDVSQAESVEIDFPGRKTDPQFDN